MQFSYYPSDKFDSFLRKIFAAISQNDFSGQLQFVWLFVNKALGMLMVRKSSKIHLELNNLFLHARLVKTEISKEFKN